MEFFALILACFFLCGGLFFVLNEMAGMKLSTYLESSDYIRKMSLRTADDLQSYVTEHHLQVGDQEALGEWVKRQQVVTLLLKDQGLTLFDSLWHSSLAVDFYSDRELDSYFLHQTISFSDADASIYLTGAFGYQLYTWVTILVFILCTLLFLLLTGSFIQRKIRYLSRLSHEIQILEGGNLEYSIAVCGHDELAGLAASLNHMRISLQQQIQAEKEAREANHQLITALSHDLRTPLTTQMGYLEIARGLLQTENPSKEELDSYLSKCLRSGTQLKQMSDSLFEYFLVTSPDSGPDSHTLSPYPCPEIFLQLLSEKTTDFEERGFQFQYQISETRGTVLLNLNYLLRIMDNLFSNFEKYAERSVPILLELSSSQTNCLLCLENQIRTDGSKAESTKIGVRSIAAMMTQMDGHCRTKQTETAYRTELEFSLKY